MIKKNEEFKEELQNQYTILIKAEERRQNKRNKILFIICILTLIMTFISLISVIISLNNTKKEHDKNSEPKVVYQTLVTGYNNGKLLSLENIGNGYHLTQPKIITISNEGDANLIYSIKVANIQTSLLSTNNLVYTLTKNNDVSSQKELPLKEEYLVNKMTLTPGETITYKLDVMFNGVLEDGNNTNYYKANIIIEQNNDQPDLLN